MSDSQSNRERGRRQGRHRAAGGSHRELAMRGVRGSRAGSAGLIPIVTFGTPPPLGIAALRSLTLSSRSRTACFGRRRHVLESAPHTRSGRVSVATSKNPVRRARRVRAGVPTKTSRRCRGRRRGQHERGAGVALGRCCVGCDWRHNVVTQHHFEEPVAG